MVYEYRCPLCLHVFDVTKSVKDMSVNEYCPKCDELSERQFTPQRVHFTGMGVSEAEWNPAFGQVVKNKNHREELAKRRGLVEVGNDFGSGEKMDQKFDADRAAKREREWDAL